MRDGGAACHRCGAPVSAADCWWCVLADRYADIPGPDLTERDPARINERGVWAPKTVALVTAMLGAGLIGLGRYTGGVILAVVTFAAAAAYLVAYGAKEGFEEALRHVERASWDDNRKAFDEQNRHAGIINGLIASLTTLARSPDAGYLYIIEFSTGGVKVGQTARPRGRFNEHAGLARAFGVEVTRLWFSQLHTDYLRNERALIERCRLQATPVRKEYFPSLTFDAAHRIAVDLELPGSEYRQHGSL